MSMGCELWSNRPWGHSFITGHNAPCVWETTGQSRTLQRSCVIRTLVTVNLSSQNDDNADNTSQNLISDTTRAFLFSNLDKKLQRWEVSDSLSHMTILKSALYQCPSPQWDTQNHMILRPALIPRLWHRPRCEINTRCPRIQLIAWISGNKFQ